MKILKSVFGNDEFFIVAFERPDIFTKESLSLINSITAEFESVEEIKDVKSLSNIDDTIGYDDYFEVRKFLEQLPKTDAGFKALKDLAVKNHLIYK